MSKFYWLVHGVPAGQNSNATSADPELYRDYARMFYAQSVTDGGRRILKDKLHDGTTAYSITLGSGDTANQYFGDINGRGGSYAAMTVFFPAGENIPDENKLIQTLNNFFEKNIINNFIEHTPNGGLRWKPNATQLFNNNYDDALGRALTTSVNQCFLGRTKPTKQTPSDTNQYDAATKKLQDEINKLEQELAAKKAQLAKMQNTGKE